MNVNMEYTYYYTYTLKTKLTSGKLTAFKTKNNLIKNYIRLFGMLT